MVQAPLTQRSPVAIRRVHAVVNPASGGVAPGAVEALAAAFAELGLEHSVTELGPEISEEAVRSALDAGPDLVVVLGGDGTTRLVAEICGPDGPLVAPLCGGTMNKLGRTLYGSMPWREALVQTLERGAPRWMPGGEVGGRAFYCGGMLGSLALFAPAREAIRAHDLRRAWRRAVIAARRAFLSRLSYEFDGQVGEATVISLLCPTNSRAAAGRGRALRAGVIEPPEPDAETPAGGRLALLGNLIGDWRDDPESTMPCVRGRAWARAPIPVMLDGELFRFGREVEIAFRPRAFRALAPRGEPPAGGPGPISSSH
jgi:hypothetical protein